MKSSVRDREIRGVGRGEVHTCICIYINVSVSTSFHCIILWAPPVASQFSVVRAPPVATLVRCVHSLRHVFGHRLWRLTYIVFCSVTDFCPSSGTASGDPFVPFDLITSFLCVLPVATYIHTYIHFCCSGAASCDSCHFI